MLRRFTVSMEKELLADFDHFIQHRQYKNRSEALRDLIRSVFVKDEWEGDKEVMGVITLVYDHHHSQIQTKLTEVQHDYHGHIVSATHVHMDHHNCMEVIIVKGIAGDVKALADSLTSIRGVKSGDLTMSSTGKDLN